MTLSRFVSIIDLQARTSLKAEASKLYLSYVWWVLEPLLFVAVYYVVFKLLIGMGDDRFVFFLMCGKVPYLWFSKSITMSSNSLLANKGLIASLRMPKIIFPYIVLQEVLYKQWVVFVVLFFIAFYFDSYPTLQWLWLIPVLATMYLLIVACSLLATLLVTYVQDFRIIIAMGLLLLLFASGIFWDTNTISNPLLYDILMTANPLAFLIHSIRSILMYNEGLDLLHLGCIAAASLISILLFHLFYQRQDSNLTLSVLQS